MSAQAVALQPAVARIRADAQLSPRYIRGLRSSNANIRLAEFMLSCVHLLMMKLLVFYRQNSEETRRVTEYLRDLTRTHDIREQDIKVLDPNTREGSTEASLYDVLSFPGVVVTDMYGRYIKSWSGELPLMDELMSYAYSGQ